MLTAEPLAPKIIKIYLYHFTNPNDPPPPHKHKHNITQTQKVKWCFLTFLKSLVNKMLTAEPLVPKIIKIYLHYFTYPNDPPPPSPINTNTTQTQHKHKHNHNINTNTT